MDTSFSSHDVRDRLRAISRSLQDLHRTLLNYQRREYEKFFGRIGSDFYVLQLAAEDPQFAWLRALSGEMIRIDEMVSGTEPVDQAELGLTGTRLRYLLTPTADGTSFQSHYDRAMQTNPDIIMAHAAAMRALPPAREVMLFRGGFSGAAEAAEEPAGSPNSRTLHPGDLVPGHEDHGYRALALVEELRMPPGASLPPAASANEETIFWVSDGEVHVGQPDESSTAVDPSRLLVINAGTGVEYALSVPLEGTPVHLIQAFIRPPAIGLEPRIQHADLPPPEPDTWRVLVGPEGEGVPFSIRNNVFMSDIVLEAGMHAALPSREGWDAFFMVVSGRAEVDGVQFDAGACGLVMRPENIVVSASESSRLVAFTIDPKAKITRAGRTAR